MRVWGRPRSGRAGVAQSPGGMRIPFFCLFGFQGKEKYSLEKEQSFICLGHVLQLAQWGPGS